MATRKSLRERVLATLKRAGKPITRGQFTMFGMPGDRKDGSTVLEIQVVLDALVAEGLVCARWETEERRWKSARNILTYSLAEPNREECP